MVSLWDVLPVDWLPLSVSVGCAACGLWIGCRGLCRSVGCAACGQFPRYPASGEGVAVVSVGRMVSLWDGVPQFQR